MSQEQSREVFELLLASETAASSFPEGTAVPPIAGLIVGVLAQVESNGEGGVVFDGPSVNAPVVARTIVPLIGQDVGRQVCLVFEQGDWSKPVILGFFQPAVSEAAKNIEKSISHTTGSLEAQVDGERIILEGKKEILLKCGRASITLTQDGRVLIRGTYLSSRSTGPNLIKGGSIQLN